MKGYPINREDFLHAIQTVKSGLSSKEVMEQANCVVLQNGRIVTYNDEVSCSAPSPVSKKLSGAIRAEPLLNLLPKIEEDSLEVSVGEGELVLAGKRDKYYVRMDNEILLAVKNVEAPENWVKLEEDFADAISMVQEVSGKNESRFALTCIHIHPKWIEACDGYRVIRYKMKTGVKEPTLVRKESLKSILGLGMTEFAVTQSWIHFRNPSDLIISCRRFVEEFPVLDDFLDVTGQPVNLPKGLLQAVQLAEVFSSKDDENLIEVLLKPGRMVLKGKGPHGRARIPRKVKYDGATLQFLIGPKTLAELVEKYNQCEVTTDRLKVDGGKWKYVTVLGVANSDKESE